MSYETIRTEREDSTLIIYINREDKLNALNIRFMLEMEQVLSEIRNDRTCRGVIITGTGVKAFAAGADIAEFASFNKTEAAEMSRNGHKVFNMIEKMNKPVIAAVNGFALGGGCELAMACHVRICSENAKFGQPEVNLGVPPGYGGTQRLAQIVGKGRALDMLISASVIDADTALRFGLVSSVVNQADLLDICRKYVSSLQAKSPEAIAEVIACLNACYSYNTDGFEYEIGSFSGSFQSSDFIEGTTAFIEKRKPIYK